MPETTLSLPFQQAAPCPIPSLAAVCLPPTPSQAFNCIDWTTLGTHLVTEPIPPAVIDLLNMTQAISLGTFVRLAFHDCGAARR